MSFDPGLDVQASHQPLGFRYGPEVAGPEPEFRSLDSIRPSLRDPQCAGPNPVYAIVMDVAKQAHHADLEKRMLLYGVVTYAERPPGPGAGAQPGPRAPRGRAQRMVAARSFMKSGPGRAVIYMQEFAADDPGRCFAVEAGPGDKVVVPPGWAHATLNADPAAPHDLRRLVRARLRVCL